MEHRIASFRLAGAATLVALLAPLTACDPPGGPDLAVFSCICDDVALDQRVPIGPARACTDLGDEEQTLSDAQAVCDSKETFCFPFPCAFPIENCGLAEQPRFDGVCAEESSVNAGGHFGQALASAAPGSILSVSGEDVDDFSVAPDRLTVSTTQRGSQLEFNDVVGIVDEVAFSTPGGFLGIGGGSHTLRDARLYLVAPFTVPLAADGSFTIPKDAGELIVTGSLDGDPAPLRAMTRLLTGVYDEEGGLFQLSGQIDAEGADLRIGVTLTLAFLNRPPRARAGDDQVVECGSTEETGIAHVSGVASFDLEGEEDIARYAWTVDLGVADPLVAEGRDAEIPLSLGPHVLTLSVADRSGSFDFDSIDVLVEDTAAPAFEILSPEPIQYPHSAVLTLDFAALDVCTGTADFAALLDGTGPLADGTTIDLLTELALGPHTFTLEAVDAVGNAGATSVTFEVIATFESLREAILRFREAGAIMKDGVAKGLLSQLAAAQAQENCATARNILGAFVSSVEAQAGKAIDAVAAGVLVGDAAAIAEACS